MSTHPLRRLAYLPIWATDLGILTFALTSAVIGRLLGFPTLGAIGALAMLPLAVLVLDVVPQRGAIVGGLVIALGSMLIPSDAGAMPLMAWFLLGLSGLTAVFRPAMTRKTEVVEFEPPAGQRLTIIVECQRPTEMGGIAVRPKVSPRFDPERRSLTRRRGIPGPVARWPG